MIITPKYEIKQMVFIYIVIYKDFIKKIIIDLVFATPLAIKSLIICNIVRDFNHNLNYQLILLR